MAKAKRSTITANGDAARLLLKLVAPQRWRFVHDEDGHSYLIHAGDEVAFRNWVEAGPYWDGYEGPEFDEHRINGEHDYTFTDPRQDG